MTHAKRRSVAKSGAEKPFEMRHAGYVPHPHARYRKVPRVWQYRAVADGRPIGEIELRKLIAKYGPGARSLVEKVDNVKRRTANAS